MRGDGTIAVNYGGRGGVGSTGTLYLLFFKPCGFNQELGFNHWSGGNTLYSNWIHSTQTVSDSLTFEQCTFKAFETDAAYITYNFNDGRCICKDSNAVLTVSTELSTAFVNECYSNFIATNITALNIKNQAIIYPNPTYSELTLDIGYTNTGTNDRFSIFSADGHQIYSSSIHSQQTKINLSNYPSGIYFLVATINGVPKTFKILKK